MGTINVYLNIINNIFQKFESEKCQIIVQNWFGEIFERKKV